MLIFHIFIIFLLINFNCGFVSWIYFIFVFHVFLKYWYILCVIYHYRLFINRLYLLTPIPILPLSLFHVFWCSIIRSYTFKIVLPSWSIDSLIIMNWCFIFVYPFYGVFSSAFKISFLSLVLCSLLMVCFGDFFLCFALEILWAYFICALIFYITLGETWDIISPGFFSVFTCPSSTFGASITCVLDPLILSHMSLSFNILFYFQSFLSLEKRALYVGNSCCYVFRLIDFFHTLSNLLFIWCCCCC